MIFVSFSCNILLGHSVQEYYLSLLLRKSSLNMWMVSESVAFLGTIVNFLFSFLLVCFCQDWAPILAFIEKAIQQLWKENLTFGILLQCILLIINTNLIQWLPKLVLTSEMFSGDSINHVADIIRKDQIWKEADDILTAEEGKNQIFLKKI